MGSNTQGHARRGTYTHADTHTRALPPTATRARNAQQLLTERCGSYQSAPASAVAPHQPSDTLRRPSGGDIAGYTLAGVHFSHV